MSRSLGGYLQFVSEILKSHFAILILRALRRGNHPEFISESRNDALENARFSGELREVADQFHSGVGFVDVLASGP